MMGLVYKDFKLSKKNLQFYAMFLIGIAVLSAANLFSPALLSGFVIVVGMNTTLATFSWDNIAHWDIFAITLPGGRRAVVAGKYLFTLLCTLGVSAFSAILLLILKLIGTCGETDGTLLAIPVCAAVSLGMSAILLPLVFKFGVEKSRILGLITFALCFGSIFAFIGAIGTARAVSVPDAVIVAILCGLIVLLVAAFAVSYFLSRRIYEHKEF